MSSPVVHVVVAGEIGGAERMLVDLATHPTRAMSIALFTPNPALRALFADSGLAIDDRGPVREDAFAFLRRSMGRADTAWLRNAIERRSAKIVHVHTFGSQVIGTRAALAAGAKILRTEHSTRVYDDPSCWPFSRWSLERASNVVAISQHVRAVALAKAPWATVDVIPNGVDVDRFTPRPLPENVGVRFLSLGRLDRRKGIDIALQALSDVPHASLDIVGDGGERKTLEALAAEIGVSHRVRFLGYRADVRDAVAIADVALSSARSEGLGIALLEAMAMQKPVVALPTGGVPEIVTDGVTGWLAPGKDAASLAEAMRDAVRRKDERLRRGSAAGAVVRERFSIEAMRASYEARYAALE